MSECEWIPKRGMEPQIRLISKLTDIFRIQAIEMRLIQYQANVQPKPNIVQSSMNRVKLYWNISAWICVCVWVPVLQSTGIVANKSRTYWLAMVYHLGHSLAF